MFPLYAFIFIVLAHSSTLPSYYHTTDDIIKNIKSLKCQNLQVIYEDPIHSIKLGPESSNKAFLLFGEHPRELISVELAYYLTQKLCENYPINGQLYIVLNSNPKVRRKVEKGEYCQRTNINGVDLNRNWEAYWQAIPASDIENYSGPYPFSEEETKIMKSEVDLYSPSVFISVHSGRDHLMYPYAYSDHASIGQEQVEAHQEILEQVKQKNKLKSEVGQAPVLLHYNSTGTSLDYEYDRFKDFSFALEIFDGTPRSYSQALLDNEENQCFLIFNPDSYDDYLEVLETWSQVLIDIIDLSLDRAYS